MPPVSTIDSRHRNNPTLKARLTPPATQRHHTLPPAQTSSARTALQSFYCQLCSKGYSRMNDYEAHLGSYDHTHKQRLKDMKAMVRDPAAQTRARRAEAKADGLVSIRLGDGGGTDGTAGDAPGPARKGGFRKSGFKSAFGPADPTTGGIADGPGKTVGEPSPKKGQSSAPGMDAMPTEDAANDDHDSADDEDYEHYDPNFPTPSQDGMSPPTYRPA